MIYERIVAEDSLMDSARGFLAQIQARHGDRSGAEREIEWQIARTSPRDRGEAVIHAAAIAAELGDEERAVQLARRAIELGFYYTHRSIHWQPRLELLWRIPAARGLLKPRG